MRGKSEMAQKLSESTYSILCSGTTRVFLSFEHIQTELISLAGSLPFFSLDFIQPNLQPFSLPVLERK